MGRTRGNLREVAASGGRGFADERLCGRKRLEGNPGIADGDGIFVEDDDRKWDRARLSMREGDQEHEGREESADHRGSIVSYVA